MKLWYCSPAPFLLDFSIRILFFLFVLECFSSSFLFFHILSVSPFPYFSLYSYPCSFLSSSFTSYLFPSLSPILIFYSMDIVASDKKCWIRTQVCLRHYTNHNRGMESLPSMSGPLAGVKLSGQQPNSDSAQPGQFSLLGPPATLTPSLQQPWSNVSQGQPVKLMPCAGVFRSWKFIKLRLHFLRNFQAELFFWNL